MNSNSIHPRHPGIKVSPQEWDRSERNHIIALQRRSMRYSLPAAVPLPFPPAPPTWKPLPQGSFFHITDYETMHGSMFASLGPHPPHHHHPVAGSILQPKSTEDLNRMPFTNLTNTTSPNIWEMRKGILMILHPARRAIPLSTLHPKYRQMRKGIRMIPHPTRRTLLLSNQMNHPTLNQTN